MEDDLSKLQTDLMRDMSETQPEARRPGASMPSLHTASVAAVVAVACVGVVAALVYSRPPMPHVASRNDDPLFQPFRHDVR